MGVLDSRDLFVGEILADPVVFRKRGRLRYQACKFTLFSSTMDDLA